MTQKGNIKIEEINKENPFKVPDNYFKNFSIRLTDKISHLEATKVPVAVRVRLRPKMAVIMAFAGIAVILLIGVVYSNLHNKPLTSKEMIEAYKYSAIQGLTDEQLAQMLAEQQKEERPGADSLKQASEKKAIIEYLSSENIDINTIIDAQ
jgi:hypothetical protein